MTDSPARVIGPCWFLFRNFNEDTWQLFVEGDVEHDGASPSVGPEWALMKIGDLFWPWSWLTGCCGDCRSVDVEKLLPLGCC